jgi:spore maturation protein A
MMNKIFAGMICVAAVVAAVSGRLSQTDCRLRGRGLGGRTVPFAARGHVPVDGADENHRGVGAFGKALLIAEAGFKAPVSRDSPTSPAMQSIAMNLTANILGLANAATPLGLKAMSELDRLNGGRKTASNEMCTFVISIRRPSS